MLDGGNVRRFLGRRRNDNKELLARGEGEVEDVALLKGSSQWEEAWAVEDVRLREDN